MKIRPHSFHNSFFFVTSTLNKYACLNNSFNILIHTRQCTRYTNTSCCVILIVIFQFNIVQNPVGFNPIIFISPEQWKSYLFLAPKFVEHFLNFLPPVLLHGVEAFLRGRHKGRGGYFIQPTKDFRKSRPLMRLLMPAI